MLVDDEPDALEDLRMTLDLEDIDAVGVTSIEEAYALLMTDPQISVVVTDVQLVETCGAVTDGLDFAMLAGRRFRDRALSFIVLSNNPDAETAPSDCGSVDLLTKPLVIDTLISAIHAAMGTEHRRTDAVYALPR